MEKLFASEFQLPYERIRCGLPYQWLYLFEDAGVVFSENGNRFAGLDAAGVAAYLALDARAPAETGTPARLPYLPEDASGGIETIRALAAGEFPGNAFAEPAEWTDFGNATAIGESADIEIHGIAVRLAIPAGPWEPLCRDPFRACFLANDAAEVPAQWRLSAELGDSGWVIQLGNREFFSSLKESQLGLGLLHAARSLLYAEGRYDVAFHAGMVACGDCGLLLCAPREAGKSTLAAYLSAHGYDLVADEPALLDLKAGTVASLQLPISLKEGSWPGLAKDWPQLADAPVHLRSDGVRIRMAHPESLRFRPRRVTRIVFPHYAPAAAPEIEGLSVVRTLEMLNAGGMQLDKRFGRVRFEQMLQWLSRTPAYRMRYGSLRDASKMLAQIGCPEG